MLSLLCCFNVLKINNEVLSVLEMLMVDKANTVINYLNCARGNTINYFTFRMAKWLVRNGYIVIM